MLHSDDLLSQFFGRHGPLLLVLTLLAFCLSLCTATEPRPLYAAEAGVTPTVGAVIFNEYAADDNANGADFFELLVIANGVDLRGVRVTDNELSNGVLTPNEAVYRFGNDTFLANLPSGALIAVWSTTAGVTTDTVINPAANDWKLVLAPGVGVTVTDDGLGGGSNAGLAVSGEALYLYRPGPDGNSAGSDNLYLDFLAYEADRSPAPTGLAALYFPSFADNGYFTGNTATAADLTTNWVLANELGMETPGDPNPTQDLSGLRTGVTESAPAITSHTPLAGSSGVAWNSTLTLNFNEAVNLSPDAVTLACPTGVAVALTGLPATNRTSITLTPNTPLPANTSCEVTVRGTAISDVDTNDPPDTLAADVRFRFTTVADLCPAADTPIGAIQGSGNIAAITGAVTVQGVVVGDYEGASPALRGFYLQDSGDGNPATSDGIFVFNGDHNLVEVGDVVQVSGTAGELQGQTQIGGSVTVIDCGSTQAVTPVDLALPLAPTVNGVDSLERVEGMLVRLPQTLYVTEHFQLGRFGQVVVSSGDRLYQPTQLFPPGGVGSQGAAQQQANNLNRLIVDDTLNNQNPDPIRFGRNGAPLSADNTLRGGDTVVNLVGVLTYGWGGNSASPNGYRLRPGGALGGGVPDFQAANERPAPPDPGGTLRVTAFNVLNYFNNFADGNPATAGCFPSGSESDCRGAESQVEFDRQQTKLVNAIVGSGAHIIGLMELENDGYGATSALQSLVNGLNAATAPATYSLLDVDSATGQVNALGLDAIKVGLIYNATAVHPVGQTAVLNTGAFGLFQTGSGNTQRNRPALAQTFARNLDGAQLLVVVNHLKSKGSPCDDNLSPVGPDLDLGDGQGNCNLTRTAAANELIAWLASDPTQTGEPDRLVMGDLNAYAMEDPVMAFKQAGFTDLLATTISTTAYSYAFDGQWGYLDHALASATLVEQVMGVVEWHINADEPAVLDYNTNFKSVGQVAGLFTPEPYRAADHDPTVIGLQLRPPTAAGQLIYVSSTSAGKSGDIPFKDEDIMSYAPESGTWSLFFDGSDVGLTRVDIDAFNFDDEGNLLFSFDKPIVLGDLGTVDDSDIVKFIPTTLGPDTVGSFALYLDGSDVELEAGSEDIDALGVSADGKLLLSTLGTARVSGATYGDEDILAFAPTSLGSNTQGTWSLYLDGSDLALTTGSEDITGAWEDPSTATLYLTTKGDFTASSLNTISGDSDDIFSCTPQSLGSETVCHFAAFFNGDLVGFANESLDSFTLTIGPVHSAMINPGGQTGDDIIPFAYELATVDELSEISDDSEVDDYDHVGSAEDLTVKVLGYRNYLPLIERSE